MFNCHDGNKSLLLGKGSDRLLNRYSLKKNLTVLILFVFMISAVSNSFQIPSNSNSGKLVQKSVLEKGEQINN